MARVGFAGFFDDRVGTPEAIEQFDRRLTGYVRGISGIVGNVQELPDDPYERLRLGLEREVYSYTPAGVKPGTLEASGIHREMVTGTDIIVNALRGAGAQYESRARDESGEFVPQRSDSVNRSLGHVVGFAMGLATRSKYSAIATLRGVHEGVDPSSLRNRVAAWFESQGGIRDSWGEDLTEAFKVEADEDGQVRLQARFRPAGKKGLLHCPAIDERLPVPPDAPEGSKGVPSLKEYLLAIGNVAVREIWTTQFPIVSDSAESAAVA